MDITTLETLSAEDRSRIITMAWANRTPFEAISAQFGLCENDVRKLMRRSMKTSSFKLWRERVSSKAAKQETPSVSEKSTSMSPK